MKERSFLIFTFTMMGRDYLGLQILKLKFFWEMSEVGNIRIEFDGVKTPWKGLTYKEVFMALISDITDDALLLFNSEGLKEQWQAFSN